MKMRTIAKKSIVAILIYGTFIAVRPAAAFVWPVIDVSQIGSFVTNIQSGISEVANTKSQIDNALETVNSVGDQASAISKYTANLSGSVAKIGNVDLSVMTIKKIKNTIDKTGNALDEAKKSNEYLAEVTVENVESQINNGATSEEVQETISAAKSEAKIQIETIGEIYDVAEKEIITIIDQSIQQLQEVTDYLDHNKDIEPEENQIYKKRAEELIEQQKNLKIKTQEIIDIAKKQYETNIMQSFDVYAQSVEAYQSGNLSEEEFKKAGEKFKQDIASNNAQIDLTEINQLITLAEQIAEDSKKLQEDILNSQSNSREYSDDDYDKTSLNILPKYDFQYHSNHQGAYAKEIYFYDNLDEEYQTFILSQELLCHRLKEKDLEELEKHTTEFSECVTLAKTEKEYICALKGIDDEDEKCDPYQLEPNSLYSPYKRDGVYKHIIEDYSIANIQNNARNQQYADSWMRGDKSVYEEFVKQIEGSKVDTTRNGYEFMGVINLEGPKLWNKIRLVDTLHRSKRATQRFNNEKSLYLDKRDADFVNAYRNKPGMIQVETLKGMTEQQVFSNLFLHHCGIRAGDVSVDVKEKYNTEKTGDTEKNIARCLFKYAAATSGRPKSKNETYCGSNVTAQQCAESWIKHQRQAMNDSSFQTLVLSTVNNYQSVRDYAENLPASETNIRTLEDEAKKATVARDGYAAGAQINYYETMQILGIVDAEAQNLQTEILASLPEIDYNFFGEEL